MPATNNFSNHRTGLTSPADGAELVTPSDSNELTYVSRGISFAGAGTLTVVMNDNTTITIPSGALSAGVIHPIRVKQVKSTGTTATGIVSFY